MPYVAVTGMVDGRPPTVMVLPFELRGTPCTTRPLERVTSAVAGAPPLPV